MKNCKSISTVVLTALSLGLPFAAVQTCDAQTNENLFPARINLVCTSTNQNGDLVYEHVKTAGFVEDCATDMGLTNLTGLSLVFNRSNASLDVIDMDGTNLTVVCTPLSFDGGVSLANSNHTHIELLTYVFYETNTIASGSLSATEQLTYGSSNELTSFGLSGLLSYSYTDGTNSPTICKGSLLIGSAIAATGDHHDCNENDNENDDNGNGDHGNNGNHGNGNNGNHGNGNNGNGNGNGNHGKGN